MSRRKRQGRLSGMVVSGNVRRVGSTSLLLTWRRALAPLDGDSRRCNGCLWISSWATSLEVIVLLLIVYVLKCELDEKIPRNKYIQKC
jgi:hypothetical protein